MMLECIDLAWKPTTESMMLECIDLAWKPTTEAHRALLIIVQGTYSSSEEEIEGDQHYARDNSRSLHE